MSPPTIPLSWVVRQATGATANGLALDKLFERAMINPKFGDERDFISPLQLTLFYALLVLDTGDGTHAMARKPLPPQFGPLGFRILFGSPRLEDGLNALATFYRSCTPSMRFNLSINGEYAFFALQFEDDRAEATLQEDVQLCYLFFGLTSFLGRPFPLSWVATRDPSHVNLGGAHWAMKSPVKLHSHAGLAFHKSLLAEPPCHSAKQDILWDPIDKWISFIDGPAARAPDGINNRQLSVTSYAANLGVAPSTYRSLLEQQGGNFRQLREQALVNAAFDLLRSATSIESVAADLGYSDARSFRRFMKSATGRTPSELRRDLGPDVSSTQLRSRLKEVMGLIPM